MKKGREPCKVIAAAIIKGGTGKSSTIAALAQAAASSGEKVLLIDLDPQANCTLFVGADQNRPGSYQMLRGTDPGELIQETPQNIDVIAASPDLATEKTTPGSAKRLREAITPIKKRYSFIFIDTPPHIGELTFNALQACNALIVPLDTDNGSLQGLYQIVDIANQIKRSNRELSFIGTVIARYEGHTRANKYMRDVIAERGQEIGAPLIAEIRKGTALREAQLFQNSIFDYAPRSNPAQDYKKLYQRLRED